jgi:glutamine amidotransferase-like uncharacterized protein
MLYRFNTGNLILVTLGDLSFGIDLFKGVRLSTVELMTSRLLIGGVVSILLILVGVLALIPLLQSPPSDDTPAPLNLQIALYNGEGAWDAEETILTHMFVWMGCQVTTIQGDDIRAGDLDSFDVLVWPGGHYPAYWDAVGSNGKLKIQEFIDGGGGYFGICAGAYYACDYMVWMDDDNFPPPEYKVEGDELNLDLFPGVAHGPIFEIADRPDPGWAIARIDITTHSHPITDSVPDYVEMFYFGGPYIQPYGEANYTVLGTYNITETAAMVSCSYGTGRVFLVGPHGEIEEGSDRDGFAFTDLNPEPDDGGSDWPLYYEVTKWLANIK